MNGFILKNSFCKCYYILVSIKKTGTDVLILAVFIWLIKNEYVLIVDEIFKI